MEIGRLMPYLDRIIDENPHNQKNHHPFYSGEIVFFFFSQLMVHSICAILYAPPFNLI